MCSRYEINGKKYYPGDDIEIYIEYQNKIVSIHSLWGLKDKGHIVFNARSENINQYSLFKNLKHCIIKADYYFEWDYSNNKVIFKSKNKQPLLMAGLVRKNNGKNEHTIITVQPNKSVLGIHDRMPLILEKKEAIKWLFNQDDDIILKSIPKELDIDKEFEQMELDI